MTAERRAVESLPASLHDAREPASSRSNTRTSRAPACVETGGQVSRHHNLLPSCPGRRSFCCPPFSQGVIEYDDRDQIPARLLPSSHSGQDSSPNARRRSPDRTWSCRTRFRQRQTAAACAKRQPAHIYESTSIEWPRAPGTRTPSYVPNFTAYGATCLKYEGISRVGPTIRIRRQPFQYRWTEWSHRQSSSAPVQRW